MRGGVRKLSPRSRLTVQLAVVLFVLGLFSLSAGSVESLDKVVLQLKWHHQFQFAGYYAAVEKGYYKDAGLEVVIKPGLPGENTAEDVIAGKADFGVGMPDILFERLANGKPLVVLAAIFQHSPSVIFVRKDSGITNPQNLIGKKVMLRSKQGNSEIMAMLLSEGVGLDSIRFVPHTWNVDDLITGKVDAMSGYLIDLPSVLRKRGVEFGLINPITYGIDFYGDCLFTSEKEIADHPKKVADFLSASLKGWRYAMDHPAEVAEIISKKYAPNLSKDALLSEAEAMRPLIQPDLVEIGYMNPGRWRHIADTFVKLGLLEKNYSLDGFAWNSARGKRNRFELARLTQLLGGVIALIAACLLVLALFNWRLKKEVEARTRELEAERDFNEAVLKTIPGIVVVYEDGDKVVKWNENLVKESGLTEAELWHRHPLDWLGNEEDKKRVAAVLKELDEKEHVAVEADVVFPGGPVPYYHTATKFARDGRTFVITTSTNLSEIRRLEEQLRHAQKMESIGLLAGGIAHDFNNLLTAIIGYSELLQLETSEDDPRREYIDFIKEAGRKAAGLTQQLLAFSRKQILEKKSVSLNKIVEDSTDMLGKIIGEKTTIKTYLEARDPVVNADPGQLNQIVMNLAINAKEAMPDGGEIVIETQNVTITPEYADSHLDHAPGEYVMLAVTDQGCGMSDEVLEQIFDPFFTTKSRKGTGLGLSTVYGIVKQHGGHIHAYSEVGKGTTFKIYFPLAAHGDVADADTGGRYSERPKGTETIMVVDDESSIRRLIIDTLGPLGYKCLEASSGEDALEVFQSYSEDVHLLLTDVVMPGISGRDLAVVVNADRPSMKVLYMSGYTENVITHHGVLDPDVNYIPKPITPLALAEKVREVLDSGASDS